MREGRKKEKKDDRGNLRVGGRGEGYGMGWKKMELRKGGRSIIANFVQETVILSPSSDVCISEPSLCNLSYPSLLQ